MQREYFHLQWYGIVLASVSRLVGKWACSILSSTTGAFEGASRAEAAKRGGNVVFVVAGIRGELSSTEAGCTCNWREKLAAACAGKPYCNIDASPHQK